MAVRLLGVFAEVIPEADGDDRDAVGDVDRGGRRVMWRSLQRMETVSVREEEEEVEEEEVEVEEEEEEKEEEGNDGDDGIEDIDEGDGVGGWRALTFTLAFSFPHV